MTIPVRLGAFAAVLASVFALAWLAGSEWGPETKASTQHMKSAGGHGGVSETAQPPAASAEPHSMESMAMDKPETLQLVVSSGAFTSGRSQQLSFRIEDETGRPVTDFEREGGVLMHLIIVRRDLQFQHEGTVHTAVFDQEISR